jgi:hypothetical protein
MPEALTFTCEVCGQNVDDSDLKADPTGNLRRLLVNAQAFKAVTVTLQPATSSAQSDQWAADGATAQWALSGTPDTTQAVSLTVAGVSATVAVLAAGATPTTQYVLEQGASGWQLAVGTDPVPASGTTLDLSYVVTTPAVTSTSIEENNPGDPLVFCGQAHAAQWAQNWPW